MEKTEEKVITTQAEIKLKTLNEIQSEIKNYPLIAGGPNQLDSLRMDYIKNLYNYTGRNVICYYSNWLINSNAYLCDINDNDLNGFVDQVNMMNCNQGLDLILHTPGGSPTATQGIVNYLRSKFNDIRVIVPHMAMSAGTMLSCAADKILMSSHSSLGPIDPQISGIPAFNIKKEFDEAKEDLRINPNNFNYWNILLSKYPASFYNFVEDAINLSGELINQWLNNYMFKRKKNKRKINKIVSTLNSNTKSHSNHLNYDTCKKMGLVVEKLEEDEKLYNLVMNIHNCYFLTIMSTVASKLIESKDGRFIISSPQK